jgi:hypothetical protein
MKITGTDARDGVVVIELMQGAGLYEVTLPPIEAASLISALRASLEDAIGHPSADSMALPGMERVQYVEHENEVFFRVYMNDRVSHDYPVPKGTVLADELKLLADRVEARNLAKATHRSSDSPSGKKN